MILTAYPALALLGDGSQVCPDGPPAWTCCPTSSSAKKRRARRVIADKLNTSMSKAPRRTAGRSSKPPRAIRRPRACAPDLPTTALHHRRRSAPAAQDEARLAPYNPADSKPYASRQRWFRTPNDAFMTGNFHVAASLLQKVLKLEPSRGSSSFSPSTYSGAFHPTAEGQAAIADAVVAEAREVLAAHGQGRRKTAER